MSCPNSRSNRGATITTNLFAAEDSALLTNLPWLESITDVLVHIILLGSALLMILVIWKLINQDPNERVLNSVSVFTGAMIVVGAQAAGVSYSSFIVDTLGVARPFTFGLFAVAIPTMSGSVLAWFLQSRARKDYERSMRILLLVLTMAVVQFLLTYVEAVTDAGLEVGRYAVPNIAFVVGVFLYLIFQSNPDATSDKTQGFVDRLAGLMARRGSADAEVDGYTTDGKF